MRLNLQLGVKFSKLIIKYDKSIIYPRREIIHLHVMF